MTNPQFITLIVSFTVGFATIFITWYPFKASDSAI